MKRQNDGGCASGAVRPSAAWTYSVYRATLYYKGARFAIVTPDGRNALPKAAARKLLAWLNRPQARRGGSGHVGGRAASQGEAAEAAPAAREAAR